MKQYVSLLCASLLAVACGDNRPGVTPQPDAPVEPVDTCPALTLGAPELQFNLFSQLTGLRYPITGGDLAGSVVLVELYDESTGGLPPLVPGTFDLASGVNTDIATCQHCVLVGRDAPDGLFEVTHFQAEGSLQLTKVTDPLDLVFAGSFVAKLREATVDAEGHIQFTDDGACRRVDTLAFDTTPNPAACETLTDCPNELLQVCDPATQQCVAPQCNYDAGGCTVDQACIPQLENGFEGACYDLCDPTDASTCDAGFTCRQGGPLRDQGLCLREGDGALGDACEVKDASTSCTGELACSDLSNTCTETCDYFAATPGCPSDMRCSLFGRCEPADAADPAPLGGTCAVGAELASPCGTDADAFEGFCFAYRQDDPHACLEACLEDTDCAASQFCALRFTSGLGACLPDPVCGDGVLGEVGEVCDDGNTMNGDTCSANCQTVNYPASCARTDAISVGETVDGDTRQGLDGFFAMCQGGRARTGLHEFTPPSPGRLTVTVESETVHVVALSNQCDGFLGELVCTLDDAFTTDPIVQQLTTTTPVLISVGGFNVLEEGPYRVSVDFVPELCGDGIVAGREVCDDGNTTSNDGCRGDCRLIEYAAICNAAPALSLTSPNTGDTTGAPYLFENNCSAANTGRDRVYTFTAPSAGTLRLVLDQGANDLALAVFRGCGAPATMEELACSSVRDPEEAEVTLAANEQITIVVDGFNVNDAGPYTLTATFQ